MSTYLRGAVLSCTVSRLQTYVILIRSGVTDWHEQGKLVGQRDRVLSPQGAAQAEKVASILRGLNVTELLCSPMQRAVETAQRIGASCHIDVARDQRLTAQRFGAWEGCTQEQLDQDPLFQQFLERPTDVLPPGGEGVESARRRAVAAVEQALGDAATGDVLALVTHSSIIGLLLGHYMSAPMRTHWSLRVDPGSLSIMAFGQDRRRIVATNWRSDFASLVAPLVSP